MFDAIKQEWLGYRTVKKKLWRYVKPFSYNTSVSRTDGRTDGQTDGQTDRIAISISRVSMLMRDKNRILSHAPWFGACYKIRFLRPEMHHDYETIYMSFFGIHITIFWQKWQHCWFTVLWSFSSVHHINIQWSPAGLMLWQGSDVSLIVGFFCHRRCFVFCLFSVLL